MFHDASPSAPPLPPPALADFRLETYLARWEFRARFHLTASDAETLSVAELLALADAGEGDREGGSGVGVGDGATPAGAALAGLLRLPLSYTECPGAPALRAAIADTYQGLAADDIQCFAGAEEGLYALCRTLLAAGDHAIVVTPCYQSAETVPAAICDVTGVALDASEHWTLHVEQVAAAIRPRTRLVCINFPHNPTGKILERERFDALVALCRRHGLWLLSDEVYRLIERSPARRLPQAAEVYERGISLNVLSKAYGLPGLRVGWLACRDRELLDRVGRYKHYLSICNSAPSEYRALLALRHRAAVLARTRRVAREGYARVAACLAEFPHLFETYAPDGGVVMFPRYTGAEGVEAFCRRLVEEHGVLLLPASVYQSALTPVPTDRFRIGFGRRNLDDGLAALRRGLGDGTGAGAAACAS